MISFNFTSFWSYEFNSIVNLILLSILHSVLEPDDEIHRQLQQAIDQLGATQRKCQALQGELDEARVSLEQAIRGKRAAEQQCEEAASRINELTTINVNLSSAKSKLETEYSALQADYDEVHKELRLSDERVQKLSIELKSTKDQLIEEQERFVKLESIKKSLEIEVRNYQVRLEEVEANALGRCTFR